MTSRNSGPRGRSTDANSQGGQRSYSKDRRSQGGGYSRSSEGGGSSRSSEGGGYSRSSEGGGSARSSERGSGGGQRRWSSGNRDNSGGGYNRRPYGGGGGGNRRRGSGRKKGPAGLDPELLIKKASKREAKQEFVPPHSFDEMPIHSRLKRTLKEKGFEFPTHIQHETLQPLQEGRDMLGIAQTGTGKTAAFLVPLIDRWLNSKEDFQALVIVPTRELANQVEDEFRSMTRGLRLFSAVFIGGTSLTRDFKKLRRPVQLVVGTPGRLVDLYERRVLKLETINVLVLDEFDRMLDMGFAQDMKKITGRMESREQTLLFSATIDKKQKPFIDELLNNPAEIKVSSGESTGDHVDQDIIRIEDGDNKFDILVDMLRKDEFGKVLVFAETKRGVDRICGQLRRAGIKADQIHGDKTQSFRQKALDKFKRGNIQVLIATDVAARGIDVDDITHVINYQVPRDFETYIHRIGRTGRAGKGGMAITLVD